MPRIRTIKPEFWRNQQMSKMGDFTRLMAIALLNLADDEGYFEADPRLIRGDVFPFEEDSRRTTVALRELYGSGYVVLREHPRRGSIGWICAFKNHQVINKPMKSKLRVQFEESVEKHEETPQKEQLREDYGSTTVALREDYVLEEEEEGEKEEELGTGKRNSLSSESDEEQAISPDEVFAAWNESNAITKVRTMTPERRRKLKTRLADTAWPWREAIAMLPIPNTPRFTWQPDFDWLIDNSSHAVKIVEGKYHAQKAGNHDSRNSERAVGTGSLSG